jgi:hypothetical protein
MKTAAFAFALLLGSAAFAQTDMDATAYDGDGIATAAYETDGGAATAAYTAPGSDTVLASNDVAAGATIVQPGNSNPERDARGIAVISDPATVPAGWNGTAAGAAMGGPELDAVTGEPVAADTYPACTASVTDNCLQTYERQRRP